ncbi:uncharacterized protein LOC134273004 [Saccostrea cucullata]|uniref:uncharacterized protein LOC134273004 n=1 Tax=Saccostrea cuccullata TaxID=36930 RepID=UPI002ED24F4E
MVCKEPNCGEKLCEGCSKRHQKQKVTKDHSIIKLVEDVSVDEVFFCELCTDEAIPGFGYCIECIDPEILCYKCCKRHTESRRFHYHHISQDPQLLQKMRLDECFKTEKDLMENLQLKSCKENVTQEKIDIASDQPCEPCQFEGTHVPATQFCLDCQDPEPFCYPCGQQHVRQKAGRGHRLSQSMQFFKSKQEAMPATLNQTHD